MRFKSTLLALCALLSASRTFSQINDHKYRVLFLGNSYTYVNDLPGMTASAALSAGDTLVSDANTIGGYTLQQHSTDATSLGKIAAGNWDYVVLQEQSQLPSFDESQVTTEVFPFAKFLDSTVHHYNSCGRSMFYMTWGRKNGDASNCASWPPVCTYMGMDSLLRSRYMMMADSNAALLSPVGAVWRYIRANYPSIDLYQSDESHPSVAGTYAAACCFYTAIFKRSPLLISFNSTLSATDAANIRNAAKIVVFDSMSKWHIKQYSPKAIGTCSVASGNDVLYSNASVNATSLTWYFGDGSSGSTPSGVHTYGGGGTYTVTLVASNCGKSDTVKMVVNLPTNAVQQAPASATVFTIKPNPAHDILTVSSGSFMSGAYDIQVVNSLGQVVYTTKCKPAPEQCINISALPGGIYSVIVTSDDHMIFRARFIRN